MSKLKISVQESRYLFHNLQEDLKRICEEELREFEGVEVARGSAEFENLWTAVDREFRNVYEMSRFGLEIPDLIENSNELDAFRGYCEDIDGVDARDDQLIREISMETQSIQDLLEENAIYRKSIPMKIESHFTSHVQACRARYSKLLNEEPNSAEPLPPVQLPSPSLLSNVMQELETRLKRSQRILESVTPKQHTNLG